VAVRSAGNAWVSERAGKLGRLDGKTLEFTERDTPPGPAARDRQSLGNPEIDSQGLLWGGRWTQQPLLSYDTHRQVPGLRVPGRKGAAGHRWRASRAATVWATRRRTRSASAVSRQGPFQVLRSACRQSTQESGCLRDRGRQADGFGLGSPRTKPDLMARVDPGDGTVEEFKIPYEGFAFPRRMNNDANGDLWVALWNAGKLMKVDPQDQADGASIRRRRDRRPTTSVVVDKEEQFTSGSASIRST